MKITPQPLEYIKEALGITNESDGLLTTFFTENAPEPPRHFDGDGVRIRYLGHACLLIETSDVSLLIDPVISYKYDDEVGRPLKHCSSRRPSGRSAGKPIVFCTFGFWRGIDVNRHNPSIGRHHCNRR
jgi:hypothetical protein